jgi:3-oxoacyl-[acyl-carrier-protein] synthase-1
MKPIAIKATGMITGVGLNAPASCAAIRCAIDCFAETRFMVQGEWLIGSEVPLTPPSRGREKILRMALSAISECLAPVQDVQLQRIPLLLCVAEPNRPGRFADLDQSLLSDIEKLLGGHFHRDSAVIANGRVGGAEAVARAATMIQPPTVPYCIVAGVDTFLVAATLAACEEKQRLLTSLNSNGFIPGEAAGAVLLGRAQDGLDPEFRCLGVAFAVEKATIESEEPLKADGLATAFRAALADARCDFEDIDYRITDANGEQYVFKEAALGLARTLRILKPEFDIWHAADCIGEVGAATVPCAVSVAEAAARKEYAPGPGVLAHFGNDDGQRAAMILGQYTSEAA